MGTGCTAGSAALYPVRQVDLVEIEPAMIEGAKFFHEDNHFVHDNPKVKIRITDGRLFLRMHRADFDVIISEPSNPWLAGSSDLFTADFFENAALSLKDGGLFCQWVQIYALSPENFATLIRTFVNVFPHTYLISSRQNIDVLLLGSKRSFVPDLHRITQRMQNPAIKEDLADRRVGVYTVHDLLARIRMGPGEVRDMVGKGVLHTDDHPVIAYRAPRDLYVRTEEKNISLMVAHAAGIAPYLELQEFSKEGRIDFLRHLAVAYERFLPGGREAAACEQLIERIMN
jgi:spermidine synthase